MDARNTGNDGYFYGGGASPALHDGRIYVVNDNEEASFAAAFDARTGAELWRVPRDERSNRSTPYVWQNELRTEIVTVGSRRVRSYDVNGGCCGNSPSARPCTLRLPSRETGCST
jgi:hypothetical protein